MKTAAPILTILAFLILSIGNSYAVTASTSFANTTVKLCIDKKCKTPYQIKISHACWKDVKEIFSAPFTTDKDEQDNIVNAIALIESDIYHSLAQQPDQRLNANGLYINNTIKNNFRNIKNIVGILLDNHLVKHHFMRKTIITTNWLGVQNTSLLLQSLNNSKLYVLEVPTRRLGESAVIRPYKDSATSAPQEATNATNSLNNDDFE